MLLSSMVDEQHSLEDSYQRACHFKKPTELRVQGGFVSDVHNVDSAIIISQIIRTVNYSVLVTTLYCTVIVRVIFCVLLDMHDPYA